MNYSLGNMLVNGGSLGSDGLSLDLQFAADKTLTARKGPTPAFTRASTATFIGSDGLIQSAAINAARFDHDPITLACKGLLIEESRTNLALRSEEFDNSYWSKGNTTVTPDSIASPSGSVNADSLLETTTNGFHTFRAGSATLSANGTTYTSTIFIKANGRTKGYFTNTIGGGYSIFDLTAKTNVFGGNGTNETITDQTITEFPNGWFRLSLTSSFTGIVSILFGVVISNDSGALSYGGDITKGFYVWGAQLEAGAFPTSYIPTTTGSVVRSADICSITGADFTSFYNEFAGTVLCESTLNGISLSVTPNTASFGAPENQISMREYTVAGSLNGLIISDENTTFNSFTGNVPSGAARKSAMAFQNEGSAILCLNGTLGTQGDSVVLPSAATGGQTPTQLNLFIGQFSTVKSFRYFKKRLANAKLQALTA